MKHPVLATLIVSIAAIFSSCLEGIENKSVVHPDGSITRSILFSGDSSAIALRSFKLRLDSSWSITTSRHDDKSWRLKAEQVFQNDLTMNAALQGEPGKTLTASVHLEKSFQWFFTAYRYTETWKCFRLVDAEPMSPYFSSRELDLLSKHGIHKEPSSPEDSVAMNAFEKKFKEWRLKNLFEAYYREFVKGVERIHSPLLTVTAVGQRKDELFRASAEKIENSEKDVKLVEHLFTAVLRSSLVGDAFRANADGFKSLVDALEYEEEIWTMGSFTVSVAMPGVITSTNAQEVNGSTANWKDFIVMSEFLDTDLTVESRSINWWAVFVTGVLVVAILLYLTIALVRRKVRA